MVLLVLPVSQGYLALLGLRGRQESLPLCMVWEVVATAWRTFSVTCRVSLTERMNVMYTNSLVIPITANATN